MSVFIGPADAALLREDHPSGPFQTVKDIGVQQLRTNATAVVRAAKLLSLPVITAASAPNGPNGLLMPEIAEILPEATCVPRNGEVDAWDAAAFPAAVRAMGKRT
jgi:hypothetical protein